MEITAKRLLDNNDSSNYAVTSPDYHVGNDEVSRQARLRMLTEAPRATLPLPAGALA